MFASVFVWFVSFVLPRVSFVVVWKIFILISHTHDGITVFRPPEHLPADQIICRPPRTITPAELVSELGELLFLDLNG